MGGNPALIAAVPFMLVYYTAKTSYDTVQFAHKKLTEAKTRSEQRKAEKKLKKAEKEKEIADKALKTETEKLSPAIQKEVNDIVVTEDTSKKNLTTMFSAIFKKSEKGTHTVTPAGMTAPEAPAAAKKRSLFSFRSPSFRTTTKKKQDSSSSSSSSSSDNPIQFRLKDPQTTSATLETVVISLQNEMLHVELDDEAEKELNRVFEAVAEGEGERKQQDGGLFGWDTKEVLGSGLAAIVGNKPVVKPQKVFSDDKREADYRMSNMSSITYHSPTNNSDLLGNHMKQLDDGEGYYMERIWARLCDMTEFEYRLTYDYRIYGTLPKLRLVDLKYRYDILISVATKLDEEQYKKIKIFYNDLSQEKHELKNGKIERRLVETLTVFQNQNNFSKQNFQENRTLEFVKDDLGQDCFVKPKTMLSRFSGKNKPPTENIPAVQQTQTTMNETDILNKRKAANDLRLQFNNKKFFNNTDKKDLVFYEKEQARFQDAKTSRDQNKKFQDKPTSGKTQYNEDESKLNHNFYGSYNFPVTEAEFNKWYNDQDKYRSRLWEKLCFMTIQPGSFFSKNSKDEWEFRFWKFPQYDIMISVVMVFPDAEYAEILKDYNLLKKNYTDENERILVKKLSYYMNNINYKRINDVNFQPRDDNPRDKRTVKKEFGPTCFKENYSVDNGKNISVDTVTTATLNPSNTQAEDTPSNQAIPPTTTTPIDTDIQQPPKKSGLKSRAKPPVSVSIPSSSSSPLKYKLRIANVPTATLTDVVITLNNGIPEVELNKDSEKVLNEVFEEIAAKGGSARRTARRRRTKKKKNGLKKSRRIRKRR